MQMQANKQTKDALPSRVLAQRWCAPHPPHNGLRATQSHSGMNGCDWHEAIHAWQAAVDEEAEEDDCTETD